MNEKLAWLFEFVAKFDSLNRANKALKQTHERLSNLAGRIKTKGQPAIEKMSQGFKKLTPHLKSAAVGIASVGLAMGAAAVVGGVALAGAGAMFALDAALFKERTMGAFKAFTGSTESAAALYTKVLDASQKFAVAPRDALDSVKQLLGAGFDMQKAMEIFAGATDLSKLTGGDTKALTTVLGQIQSKGKLQTEELLQLAESGGLAMGKVIAEIGKAKGIDTSVPEGLAKVQKMLEGGQIDSKTGIAAALAAIQNMTGKPLGKYAEEGAKSVGGLLQQIKNAPEIFLQKFNNSAAMQPLQKLLQKIVDTINDPNVGKRILDVLGRMAALAGDVFDSLSGGAGGAVESLVAGFEGIASALEAAWPYLKALGTGMFASLSKVLGPMLDGLAKLNGNKPGSGTLAAYESFGRILGFIAGLIVKVAGNLMGSFLWAFDAAVKVVAFFGEMLAPLASILAGIADAAWTWGADVMSGLWQGIKDGFTWLIQKFDGLIALLPDKVKQILGIASPSKVFADLGMWSMKGFEVGFASQAANSNAAIEKSVGASVPSPAQVASSVAGASSGGGSVSVGQMVFQLPASAAASKEAYAAAARDAVESLLAELAAPKQKTA